MWEIYSSLLQVILTCVFCITYKDKNFSKELFLAPITESQFFSSLISRCQKKFFYAPAKDHSFHGFPMLDTRIEIVWSLITEGAEWHVGQSLYTKRCLTSIVSYVCHNKLPQIQWLIRTKFLSSTFVIQKSKMGLTELKIKVIYRAARLSAGSKEESVSLPFSASRHQLHPLVKSLLPPTSKLARVN